MGETSHGVGQLRPSRPRDAERRALIKKTASAAVSADVRQINGCTDELVDVGDFKDCVWLRTISF